MRSGLRTKPVGREQVRHYVKPKNDNRRTAIRNSLAAVRFFDPLKVGFRFAFYGQFRRKSKRFRAQTRSFLLFLQIVGVLFRFVRNDPVARIRAFRIVFRLEVVVLLGAIVFHTLIMRGILYLMSFFDDISYKTVLGRAVKYSAVLMGGEAAYVDGISRIISVSAGKIEIAAGKILLEVSGEDLVIDELERESVIVKGKITGVREV